MAPQPPTSSGQTSMGPPPPPPPATTSNNVTFVLINQTPSQTNLMRPPIEPPPRRGRGRGRGRGGGGSGGGSTSPSESSGGRGRGRGRGRGAARIQTPPVERIDHQVIYIFFKWLTRHIFIQWLWLKIMVFCYQNCSDLLWENFLNFSRAENLQKFWGH